VEVGVQGARHGYLSENKTFLYPNQKTTGAKTRMKINKRVKNISKQKIMKISLTPPCWVFRKKKEKRNMLNIGLISEVKNIF
jgi:hypothetical protein